MIETFSHVLGFAQDIEDIVGNEGAGDFAGKHKSGMHAFFNIDGIVVNITVKGSHSGIGRVVAGPMGQPEGHPVQAGAVLPLDPESIVNADVVAVAAIIVIPENFDEPARVIQAQIVLDEDVFIAEVDVSAATIPGAARVQEPVIFDHDILAPQRPETTAAAAHADIQRRARTVNDIAAH